jgi:RNA polymerase sigma-54 factor
MLNQRLQQKLLQKLSPQQILLMKLLQIPSVALEQRIKQEIEENPALEDQSNNENSEQSQDDHSDQDHDENQENDHNSEDEFSFEDYIPDDDDIPAYRMNANNHSADDEHREVPFASGTSFHELLRNQLGMYGLSDKQKQIAEHIIGNIDDAGYLMRELDAMVDDLAFLQNIDATEQELEKVLQIIQQFDPSGVGGRNLQECLMIQLRRKPETEAVKVAKLLIGRYFNEFTKKHYEKILRRSKITEEVLKDGIAEILKLNPKPGNSLSETVKTNQYIIPDFIINNNDGELELSLNSSNTPELRLSRTYTEMMEDFAGRKGKKDKKQKEALMFIKQKVDSAKWFIDAIEQRQTTLLLTMSEIISFQKEYFKEGDETKLKPMILKDIAERTNLDISTISRVSNSKYIQTHFGIYPLKYFFSEGMQKEDGEEVSTREIKKILQECIENEDKRKPLTDEKLAQILKEKSYNIARRTVAKYREQLGIPVARLRKEL